MNPFEQKATKVEEGMMDWDTVYPTPYNKQTVDPYTRIRIILMNGVEVESALFKHQIHRNLRITTFAGSWLCPVGLNSSSRNASIG